MTTKDQVDQAVKAAAAQGAVAPDAPTMLETTTITIDSTGRPFIVTAPVDLTDAELIEVTACLLDQYARMLRERRARATGAGRIVGLDGRPLS